MLSRQKEIEILREYKDPFCNVCRFCFDANAVHGLIAAVYVDEYTKRLRPWRFLDGVLEILTISPSGDIEMIRDSIPPSDDLVLWAWCKLMHHDKDAADYAGSMQDMPTDDRLREILREFFDDKFQYKIFAWKSRP